MPSRPSSTRPTQALPAPKKMQSKQTSASTHEQELLPSPRTSSIRLPSATNYGHGSISSMPQSEEAEDEHTLTAYGDISLGDIIVPPLPGPTHASSPDGLQPKFPQPRLRLRVRRPPMPKRRPSYAYVTDRLPDSEDVDPDERWPGSPRTFVNNSPWLQHQPLVSPLAADPKSSWTQGDRPVKNGGGSSLERLFDELVPRSPSIRLSPPGSPASQALGLPQETCEQRNGSRQVRDVPKAVDAAKSPRSFLAPAPRRDEPKEAPWRTRLPPRLPIPKWDM